LAKKGGTGRLFRREGENRKRPLGEKKKGGTCQGGREEESTGELGRGKRRPRLLQIKKTFGERNNLYEKRLRSGGAPTASYQRGTSSVLQVYPIKTICG